MVDLKEDCLMAGENEENRVDNASTSSSSSSSSASQAGSGGGGVGDETKKACTGCNTTTTPLWRGGPAGPKTLCNACGIKYRKKRRAMMGIETGSGGKKGDKAAAAASGGAATTVTKMSSKSGNNNNNKSGIVKKPRSPKTSNSLGVAQPAAGTKGSKTAMKKMGGGGNNSWDRSAVWRKLGEEEQAAMLLIALSCGSCYA